MQQLLRYTNTSVPHFLHTLPDVYWTQPSCEQSHCLQTRSPCHDRPMRCHTFHLLLTPQKFSISGVMLYNWSKHSRPAEEKSITSNLLLINLMVNQPPNSTHCKNNAAKVIHTGRHPVQFLCVAAAPQSLKPGLCTAGSPRSTNFMGIRPRHVIRLLLNEPERRMRSQRQSCSGHVPGTGVQTIPDLAGAEHSDTWAGIKSASKKLTCQKLLELTWAGRVNEYQVSASHHVATPFWSQ